MTANIGGIIGGVNKADKDKTDTWENKDTLKDYHEIHGKEVGAKDEGDYAEKANDLYNNKDKHQVKVDEDGVTRVYDEETNTFGSYNPDGSTKTYFKPKAGQNYFDRQLGK